jgi:hypothetical protein
VLITVSGPVGSGKSTLGAALARRLSQSGVDVKLLNFQKLPCFRLLHRPDATSARNRKASGTTTPPTRRTNYQRKRLTLMETFVHVGRILSFRAWRLFRGRTGPLVLNRYFYDSFSHYDLDGSGVAARLRIIRAVMPRPDLAVVLESDVGTLATRRPEYARDYLETAVSAYRALPGHFPELTAVTSTTALTEQLLARLQVGRSPSAS